MGCGSSSDKPAAGSAAEADGGDKKVSGLELKSVYAETPVSAPEVLSGVEANEEVGEVLKEVPLLMKLKDHERAQLGGAMTKELFQDEHVIFEQGAPGDKFYVIIKGEVAVWLKDEDSGDEGIVATLEKGDYFGEGALLAGTKDEGANSTRAATTKCKGEVEVLTLTAEKFQGLFATGQNNFQVNFVTRRIALTAGVADDQGNKGDCVKSDDIKKMIHNAIKDLVLFEALSEQHMSEMIDHMYKDSIPTDVVVCRQGEFENNLYVVEQGKYTVFVKDEGDAAKEGHGTEVAVKQAGEVFGELSLMFASPRAATVICSQDSIVWKLDRFTFQRIKNARGQEKLALHADFLAKVELLASLTSTERHKIAEAVEEVSIDSDQVVFKEGDAGDAMYIIHQGKVRCTKQGVDGDVGKLGVGDYFGELALKSGEPRAATVITDTKCVFFKLDAIAFSLLLGPLTQLMEQRAAGYNEETEKAQHLAEEEEEFKPLLEGVRKEDLIVLGTLGQGSFGFVQLVKLERDGVTTTYALKGVSKLNLVQTHQTAQILNEKNIMMTLRHQNIIQLYTTFKDPDQLYFLLEPVLGGELFGLLQKQKRFQEKAARFYGGQIVLAFEYLHAKDYIFRDLKPENVLVDSEGYIKVADFGFAKKLKSGHTWTMCGTPEYLCPEIIKSAGHGKGADWWTIGVLFYELLAGHTPFYHQSHHLMYRKIASARYTFPPHFSKAAKDIISRLLCLKPTQRLGVTQGGATKVKEHEWFSSIDFKKLENKQYKAPFVPEIKNTTDLSNFHFQDCGYQAPRYIPGEEGPNWDATF